MLAAGLKMKLDFDIVNNIKCSVIYIVIMLYDIT